MNIIEIGQPEVEWNSNIIDVSVPQQLESSYRTGHEFVDLLFAGDGILPSTVGLVTGVPGSGKTSAMIQLADTITKSGGVCLYNTGEESLFQVRRVISRMRLTSGFVPGYNTSASKIIEHAERLSETTDGPIVVIQDSLQTLEYEREEGARGRSLSRENAEVRAMAQLTRWAKETFNIVLVVGQVNKKGEFAGKQAIKHIIDCHMHLGIDTDRKSPTYKERICEMTKNRFGVAGMYYTYRLDAQGIHFEQPDIWDDED